MALGVDLLLLPAYSESIFPSNRGERRPHLEEVSYLTVHLAAASGRSRIPDLPLAVLTRIIHEGTREPSGSNDQ